MSGSYGFRSKCACNRVLASCQIVDGENSTLNASISSTHECSCGPGRRDSRSCRPLALAPVFEDGRRTIDRVQGHRWQSEHDNVENRASPGPIQSVCTDTRPPHFCLVQRPPLTPSTSPQFSFEHHDLNLDERLRAHIRRWKIATWDLQDHEHCEPDIRRHTGTHQRTTRPTRHSSRGKRIGGFASSFGSYNYTDG
jgi:hypothetical protein